eukprot:91291-Prorocentrum_minimum.AAC.7
MSGIQEEVKRGSQQRTRTRISGVLTRSVLSRAHLVRKLGVRPEVCCRELTLYANSGSDPKCVVKSSPCTQTRGPTR